MDKSLTELREALLRDPDVKAQYDAMAPEYLVARAIIGARAQCGQTQAELAERMGTQQSYIARLESGTTLPSMRTFFRVAEATGLQPEIGFAPLAQDSAPSRQKPDGGSHAA